jgi:hypothetical protein
MAEAAPTFFRQTRREIMKTYRLWLEKDREFPRFMRLKHSEVDVTLKDVLTRGVHPLEFTTDIYQRDISMLSQKLISEANEEKHFVPQLAQLGYCPPLSEPPRYSYEDYKLENTLKTLSEHIFYVEELTYAELLEIARKALARKWNHRVALAMLQTVHREFNSLREFLKNKDKKLKLSGYRDLDRYALDEVVYPDDFAYHERAVILHALPTTTFRSTSFVSAVTTRDGEGLLSLVPQIKRFDIVWREYPFKRGTALMGNDIRYDCTLAGNLVRLVPTLSSTYGVREAAEAIAKRWRVGEGRFCFWTSIENIEEMLVDERCHILFSSTNYVTAVEPCPSEGEITEKRIPSFRLGEIVTYQLPNESLKAVLRKHNRPMTGRKGDLLAKVAGVLCERYEEMLPLLSEHFSKQKYLQISRTAHATFFPFMQESDILDRTVLAMYVIKHLRGNAIVDADHENDTYEVSDLVKALLQGNISVKGSFMAIQEELPSSR